MFAFFFFFFFGRLLETISLYLCKFVHDHFIHQATLEEGCRMSRTCAYYVLRLLLTVPPLTLMTTMVIILVYGGLKVPELNKYVIK